MAAAQVAFVLCCKCKAEGLVAAGVHILECTTILRVQRVHEFWAAECECGETCSLHVYASDALMVQSSWVLLNVGVRGMGHVLCCAVLTALTILLVYVCAGSGAASRTARASACMCVGPVCLCVGLVCVCVCALKVYVMLCALHVTLLVVVLLSACLAPGQKESGKQATAPSIKRL